MKNKKKGEQLQACTQTRQDMSTVCAGSVRNGVRKLTFHSSLCRASASQIAVVNEFLVLFCFHVQLLLFLLNCNYLDHKGIFSSHFLPCLGGGNESG